MLLAVLLVVQELQHGRLLAHGQQQGRKLAEGVLPGGIMQAQGGAGLAHAAGKVPVPEQRHFLAQLRRRAGHALHPGRAHVVEGFAQALVLHFALLGREGGAAQARHPGGRIGLEGGAGPQGRYRDGRCPGRGRLVGRGHHAVGHGVVFHRGRVGHHRALRVGVVEVSADQGLVVSRVVEQLAQGFARAEAGGHVLRARAEAGAPVEVLQLLGAVHGSSDAVGRPGFNACGLMRNWE